MKQYLTFGLTSLALLGALTGCSSSETEASTTSPDTSVTAPEAPEYELDLQTPEESAYETVESGEDLILDSYTGDGNHVNVPEGVTSIAAHTFSENDTIQAVTLPSTLKTVLNSAFSRCSSLLTIDFGGVVEVGTYSFAGCSSLEYVSFPSTVELIEKGAFFDCESLQTVQIGENVQLINDLAFGQCPNLTSVLLPPSVVYISPDAFDANPELTFQVTEGSYADEWARDLGLKAVYV